MEYDDVRKSYETSKWYANVEHHTEDGPAKEYAWYDNWLTKPLSSNEEERQAFTDLCDELRKVEIELNSWRNKYYEVTSKKYIPSKKQRVKTWVAKWVERNIVWKLKDYKEMDNEHFT